MQAKKHLRFLHFLLQETAASLKLVSLVLEEKAAGVSLAAGSSPLLILTQMHLHVKITFPQLPNQSL